MFAPTHMFSEDRVTLEIAGITLDLVAAPGETVDQLYVWLPEQRVVFAGDNFYQSWPNVYPLRGTERRSIRDWISSIDSMIQEDPLHVVGGHTTPMPGNAVEVLTNYRDAMQWVLDRTIEGAKLYMTPDEQRVHHAGGHARRHTGIGLRCERFRGRCLLCELNLDAQTGLDEGVENDRRLELWAVDPDSGRL